MNSLPGNISAGCGISLLGGVISIVCLALFFEPEELSLTIMGLYMLSAVLFFGMAGTFTKNSQWSWKMTVFMGFFTIGVVAASTAAGYFEMYAGALLVAIGVLILIVAMLPSTKKWLNNKY